LNHPAQLLIKHGLDRILAVIFFLIFSPMLCVIAFAILLMSGWPIFFPQTRVGLQGRPFIMLKFRTMVQGAVHYGLGVTVSQDDSRITRIGSFLRKWSLDEFPQLFNIVKGEMSFVGPRPTFEYQVANYTSHQRRRLEMKPGVTGWAQVNGRNSLSWPQRIELDVWYVDHFSLTLDSRIVLKTIPVWLMGEGLYGPDGINDSFMTEGQGTHSNPSNTKKDHTT